MATAVVSVLVAYRFFLDKFFLRTDLSVTLPCAGEACDGKDTYSFYCIMRIRNEGNTPITVERISLLLDWKGQQIDIARPSNERITRELLASEPSLFEILPAACTLANDNSVLEGAVSFTKLIKEGYADFGKYPIGKTLTFHIVGRGVIRYSVITASPYRGPTIIRT
ncbi:MAG: hypothetical protein HYY00_02960 [Chloroflexi bacterium]|nr:hypothetical protein [Chloroflexota bacterium]